MAITVAAAINAVQCDTPVFSPRLLGAGLPWTVEGTWRVLPTGPAAEHCGACGGIVPGGPCGRSVPVFGCGVEPVIVTGVIVSDECWGVREAALAAELLTANPNYTFSYVWAPDPSGSNN